MVEEENRLHPKLDHLNSPSKNIVSDSKVEEDKDSFIPLSSHRPDEYKTKQEKELSDKVKENLKMERVWDFCSDSEEEEKGEQSMLDHLTSPSKNNKTEIMVQEDNDIFTPLSSPIREQNMKQEKEFGLLSKLDHLTFPSKEIFTPLFSPRPAQNKRKLEKQLSNDCSDSEEVGEKAIFTNPFYIDTSDEDDEESHPPLNFSHLVKNYQNITAKDMHSSSRLDPANEPDDMSPAVVMYPPTIPPTIPPTLLRPLPISSSASSFSPIKILPEKRKKPALTKPSRKRARQDSPVRIVKERRVLIQVHGKQQEVGPEVRRRACEWGRGLHLGRKDITQAIIVSSHSRPPSHILYKLAESAHHFFTRCFMTIHVYLTYLPERDVALRTSFFRNFEIKS